MANLRLAVARLDGIVLYPGETFSYWRLIGKPTRRKGLSRRDGAVSRPDRQRCGRRAVPALQSDFLDDSPHAADGSGAVPSLSRCLSGYQPDPALRQRRHLRLSPPGSDDPQRHGTALPALCPGGKAGSEGRVAGPGTSGLPL